MSDQPSSTRQAVIKSSSARGARRLITRLLCYTLATCGLAALTISLAPSAYAANGEPWGDGPKSTTFDDGGISPARCRLSFTVVERSGNLEATANVDCDASPGKVAGLIVNFYIDNLIWKRNSTKFTNTYSVTETLRPETGRLCLGAQGVKNGSLTGSNQVVICGSWPT